jgi:hypothetical protein
MSPSEAGSDLHGYEPRGTDGGKTSFHATAYAIRRTLRLDNSNH